MATSRRSEWDRVVDDLLAPYQPVRGKDRRGARTALAQRIGISLTPFLRGLKEGRTFSVHTLLRLALETGVDIDRLLRAGDKADVADMLRQLYGEPAPISRAERDLLNRWGKLDTTARRSLEALLRALTT